MTESATTGIDAPWIISTLRELDRRTGGPDGAQRLAWTGPWHAARSYLAELLGQIGLEPELDEAGNAWALLPGEQEPALVLGSHLDSVPEGGWLDGALGVVAAVGVLRAWAGRGERPPRSLALVDWADEEGARFGHSLFGSSAFAGVLDVEQAGTLIDRDGKRLADVVASEGIDASRLLDAGQRRGRLHAYLELHIEQGPVLEAEGLRAAAVSGCVGVERQRLRFTGQAAHAGTTPMDLRRDAGLAAAMVCLTAERVARDRGGTATTGIVELTPGTATVIPGASELVVDLRHGDQAALAAMLADTLEGARAAASRHRCELQVQQIWSIAPTVFDRHLVERARLACMQAAGADRVLVSGALHDAAMVARVLPAAMIFTPSIGGLSHTAAEDTAEDDLTAAIEAFGLLADGVLRS